MQSKTKYRLKIEAVESMHMLVLALVIVVTALSLDALFGHDRDALAAATVIVCALGMALVANTLLNIALADLRERLYGQAETDSAGGQA